MRAYRNIEFIGTLDGMVDTGQPVDLIFPTTGTEPIAVRSEVAVAINAGIEIDDMPTYLAAFWAGKEAARTLITQGVQNV